MIRFFCTPGLEECECAFENTRRITEHFRRCMTYFHVICYETQIDLDRLHQDAHRNKLQTPPEHNVGTNSTRSFQESDNVGRQKSDAPATPLTRKGVV